MASSEFLCCFLADSLPQAQSYPTAVVSYAGIDLVAATELTSAYISESQNPFLSLWPHRFDYLWAEHPLPGNKPDWQTESRHPLSDRLLEQKSYLYGVRFGRQTCYIMIDIDMGSAYHPRRDYLAFERLLGTLEPLGLVRPVICTSSTSGGLHIYFPLQQPYPAWELAVVVKALVERDGFRLAPGLLETFPNARPFSNGGHLSLYNGHRLPLQQGSYLLNRDLEPVYSTQTIFTEHWQHAAKANDIEQDIYQQTLSWAQRRTYRVSAKAEKFLNDLNAEIELGWTGPGQTNRLLGRIAMRSYIFGHLLGAPIPLSGEALVQNIIQVATNLSGYVTWCRHQHELGKKAKDWARAIEASDRYYPYGSSGQCTLATSEATVPWHEQQARQARERIRQALASLLEQNRLPIGIKERFIVLTQEFGIGGSTLYRYKELWHPNHILERVDTAEEIQSPPDPPTKKASEGQDRVSPSEPPSLLDTQPVTPHLGGDSPLMANGTVYQSSNSQRPHDRRTRQLGIWQDLAKARIQQAAERQYRQRELAADCYEKLWNQMMAWLDSGDPILINEALTWLERNSGSD